jgi:hypothetical protein
MAEVDMALSNIERARIAEFIACEKEQGSDWFLSDTAEHLAPTADVMIYFSAFCVGLSHLNSALGGVETTLKRIKTIMTRWHALVQNERDGGPESKALRLKPEEKMLVQIYRSLCAGKGGLSTADAAKGLKITEAEAERLLASLRDKGVVTQSQHAKRWRLVLDTGR